MSTTAVTTAPPAETLNVPFHKWTSSDDMLLKYSIEKRPDWDFADIARNVKFAQRYTAQELRDRWNALLYDPEISFYAAKNMMILMTQQVKRMPWTYEEDDVLREAVRQNRSANAISFTQLLDKHRDVFHPSRNVKSVETHFYRMKQKGEFDSILGIVTAPASSSTAANAPVVTAQDGTSLAVPSSGFDPHVETLAEVEQDVLKHTKRKQVRREKGPEGIAATSSKKYKGEDGSAIKKSGRTKKSYTYIGKKALELEREHALNSPLEQSVLSETIDTDTVGKKRKRSETEGIDTPSPAAPADAPAQLAPTQQKIDPVFAYFCGHLVNLPVTKEYAKIGRKNKSFEVDVDLAVAQSDEEQLNKLSRLQAELRLVMRQTKHTHLRVETGAPMSEDHAEVPGCFRTRNVESSEPVFLLKNSGKKKITVNGNPLATDQEMEISHLDSVVFPGEMHFNFMVNLDVVHAWAKQHTQLAVTSGSTPAAAKPPQIELVAYLQYLQY